MMSLKDLRYFLFMETQEKKEKRKQLEQLKSRIQMFIDHSDLPADELAALKEQLSEIDNCIDELRN